MRDIHEVLRRKQAKYAQLGKEIEMLQQAADKLREVAPLLADNDEEDSAILLDADEPSHAPAPSASPKPAAAAVGASSSSQPSGKPAQRNAAPRWP